MERVGLDEIAPGFDLVAHQPREDVGGVLAIIPTRGALCAWGPGLDKAGNSIAAVRALDAFTTATGWSVF